jgi:Domain of unknown function (DUF4402)
MINVGRTEYSRVAQATLFVARPNRKEKGGHLNSRPILLTVFLFEIFLLPDYVRAQNNPTIMLLRQPLSFGMVLTNTTNTIAPSDPNAAEIQINFSGYSALLSYLTITFTLPPSLSSGGNTLSITFGPTSAAWNTTNSISGSTTFDPSSGYSRLVGGNNPITIYVWIGGTISPPNQQAAGNYSGTVTVTASATTILPFNTYTASMNFPVTATVIRGLSMTAVGSLDFGQMLAGTTPPSLSAQTNPGAPMFTSAGQLNHRITATYSSSSSLNDGYGHTLTFSPSLFGATSWTNQAASSHITSGSSVTLTGDAGGTGYYYFWLGGGLGAVPAGQPAGTYTGTFNLTVSY